MKILFVVLFAVIGLFGCEDIVSEVDLPTDGSRVVVSAYISPTDTLISVYLLESSPLFSDSDQDSDYDYDNYYSNGKVIQNAKVLLSRANSSAITLVFDEEKGKYTIDAKLFPIEYGQTYTLNVTTEDGKEVSAITTIPTGYFSDIETKVDKVDAHSTNDFYNISVSWIDEKGMDNYYRLAFVNCLEYDCQGFYVSGERLNFLVSDQGKDGGKLGVSNSELYLYDNYGSNDGLGENDTINVVITKLAKPYYEFLKYSYTYEESPFSEPTTTATNIEGGLGVFVGYATFNKEIVLE